MTKRKTNVLPALEQVDGAPETPCIEVRTASTAYRSRYTRNVEFLQSDLKVDASSWVWQMLEQLQAESVVAELRTQEVVQLREVLIDLSRDEEALRIVSLRPAMVGTNEIGILFQRAEGIYLEGGQVILAHRVRNMTFRRTVLEKAALIGFREPLDAQRIRFRTKLRDLRPKPRELISDLHQLDNSRTSLPIGALPAQSAAQLTSDIASRSEYDINRIREACISDLNFAAQLRKRAAELRQQPVSLENEAAIRAAMFDRKNGRREILRASLKPETILAGVLKIVHKERLFAQGGIPYFVPLSVELRSLLCGGVISFKSEKLFEIEHLACVEEIFAAFHLIHTYVPWNWGSVMALGETEIVEGQDGYLTLQSAKSTTDDNTPFETIHADAPGIRDAVQVLKWNRAQLVLAGFLPPDSTLLWATRWRCRGKQAAHHFHPAAHLANFIERYSLPRYSFEQVRKQHLFSASLKPGGIEFARQKAGHTSISITDRYAVFNILQNRIASARNLEFSKKLESEIRYLYEGGDAKNDRIELLRPIGDGASCANSFEPPSGYAKNDSGECAARACHTDGGCPNRRIEIDDARIEEAVRLNRYYTAIWNRLRDENPDRFVTFHLQGIVFNAALLLALRNGPYAHRVAQIADRVARS